MKRLLVFLVLVGLAVPGWADSTDTFHGDVDTALVSDVVSGYSFNFYRPASLVVLGAPASALFDSVWVFPPKKCFGGGMVLRLKGFYVTPKHSSVADWPEIYHIYADTIICKGRCGELTNEEVIEWLEKPYHRKLFLEEEPGHFPIEAGDSLPMLPYKWRQRQREWENEWRKKQKEKR